MKRKQLVRQIAAEGCYLKRRGGRHDIYANPDNGRIAPVPRHSEIRESLCRLIKQQLGIQKSSD
ncbi:MAG: type II toxin-antitoxin system HicA family toxin [Gammaproteobacteria bacterium]|nr:type II toxin-antitoxin system HicA family toxin [Gammaproteobacteria bacterium]